MGDAGYSYRPLFLYININAYTLFIPKPERSLYFYIDLAFGYIGFPAAVLLIND